MNDGTGAFIGGFIIGVVFAGLIVVVGKQLSHEALGSKGYACFANMTCREGLKCLRADGIAPTCVKP